ncbi:Highly acidic protein [hydrothermal vent metagenome]|uniref:Highly acidic protein n=1 Tax=hydrothermal vent metagenome TaxID=652676 RepID=A0A1W1D0H7_9ZZZZ
MHILLINTNPIVSKLFKSLLEDENIELDEVSHVSKIKEKKYSIVFIDESLCQKNSDQVFKNFSSSKKVCISYDLEEVKRFDATLQKPFLPSQIMDIIEDLAFENTQNISILDNKEIETIKSLLKMDDFKIEEKKPRKKKLLKVKQIKKEEKKSKEIVLNIKKLKKKSIKSFLKGKEITIRIQLTEEF